ncbi:MAG: hypothetical protein AAFP84_13940 [Actinomycetota bacterium]
MDLAPWLGDSDALVELDAAHEAAWRVADSELLALCRDRLGMLLRHRTTLDAIHRARAAELRAWATSDAFDHRARAALEFTEQYVVDVAAITDEQADAVRAHLGDDAFATFVNALLVVEQRMTLELGLAAVLGEAAPA